MHNKLATAVSNYLADVIPCDIILRLAVHNLELGLGVGGASALDQRDGEEHSAGQEDHRAGQVEAGVVRAQSVVQSTYEKGN